MMIHGKLPARIMAEEVGWLLNCPPHNIPILVAARLLKPLGHPEPNAVKFFSTEEILELSKDRVWLSKTTNAISQHWRNKNAQRKTHAGLGKCENGGETVQIQ